jgi:hypothetical protein
MRQLTSEFLLALVVIVVCYVASSGDCECEYVNRDDGRAGMESPLTKPCSERTNRGKILGQLGKRLLETAHCHVSRQTSHGRRWAHSDSGAPPVDLVGRHAGICTIDEP